MRRLSWRVCFLACAAVGVASCGDVDDPLSEGVWADCRTGGRSAMAVAKMKTLQFQTVYNLLGGITRWKAEGYPTVR